jgi:hypothetical protein
VPIVVDLHHGDQPDAWHPISGSTRPRLTGSSGNPPVASRVDHGGMLDRGKRDAPPTPSGSPIERSSRRW